MKKKTKTLQRGPASETSHRDPAGKRHRGKKKETSKEARPRKKGGDSPSEMPQRIDSPAPSKSIDRKGRAKKQKEQKAPYQERSGLLKGEEHPNVTIARADGEQQD